MSAKQTAEQQFNELSQIKKIKTADRTAMNAANQILRLNSSLGTKVALGTGAVLAIGTLLGSAHVEDDKNKLLAEFKPASTPEQIVYPQKSDPLYYSVVNAIALQSPPPVTATKSFEYANGKYTAKAVVANLDAAEAPIDVARYNRDVVDQIQHTDPVGAGFGIFFSAVAFALAGAIHLGRKQSYETIADIHAKYTDKKNTAPQIPSEVAPS